jgi:hypothetical protein
LISTSSRSASDAWTTTTWTCATPGHSTLFHSLRSPLLNEFSHFRSFVIVEHSVVIGIKALHHFLPAGAGIGTASWTTALPSSVRTLSTAL